MHLFYKDGNAKVLHPYPKISAARLDHKDFRRLSVEDVVKVCSNFICRDLAAETHQKCNRICQDRNSDYAV